MKQSTLDNFKLCGECLLLGVAPTASAVALAVATTEMLESHTNIVMVYGVAVTGVAAIAVGIPVLASRLNL